MLTTHLQTELAIHTREAVSDIRHDVSDIRRTMVKGQEGVDVRNQMVSNHDVLFMIGTPYSFLDSGQVCNFNCGCRPKTLSPNPAYLENRLPYLRGPASGGTN